MTDPPSVDMQLTLIRPGSVTCAARRSFASRANSRSTTARTVMVLPVDIHSRPMDVAVQMHGCRAKADTANAIAAAAVPFRASGA